MDIFTYADALGLDLVVTRHAQQNDRWSAKFDRVHVRDGSIISGVHGNGLSPAAAIEDYAEQISGQVIEYKHYNNQTEEFIKVQQTVPKLTI